MSLPKLIAIVGTTASGKSDLAIEIAKELGNAEIISVDSRQIYKEMDLGTNKEPGEIRNRNEDPDSRSPIPIPLPPDCPITLEEALNTVYTVQDIPHYLISVVRPDQTLTLAHIQALANGIIEDITARGKTPILVGGTSLYTTAIAENWEIPDVQPNPNLRQELESLETIELVKRLDQVAPAKTQTIDLGNRHRLIRAIEIASQGKINKSPSKLEPRYDVLYLAPIVDREELYERINQRVDRMVKEGLIEEVKAVGEKYGYDIVAMTGHAYQQIGKYLQGEWTLEQAIEESKKVTRNYAKRQLTWWKKHGDVKWVQNKDEAFRLVRVFLK